MFLKKYYYLEKTAVDMLMFLPSQLRTNYRTLFSQLLWKQQFAMSLKVLHRDNFNVCIMTHYVAVTVTFCV